MCGRSFLMWPMVSLRQNGVPLIRVGLRRGRSWRECDHSTIDGDVIGTSFARGCEHRGERALALSTWHWHRLRRRSLLHSVVVWAASASNALAVLYSDRPLSAQ